VAALVECTMKVSVRRVWNVLFYNDVSRSKIVQNMLTFRNFTWKGFVGKEQG
jgi:hypothetical protein